VVGVDPATSLERTLATDEAAVTATGLERKNLRRGNRHALTSSAPWRSSMSLDQSLVGAGELARPITQRPRTQRAAASQLGSSLIIAMQVESPHLRSSAR
jgi:hypothetical protein